MYLILGECLGNAAEAARENPTLSSSAPSKWAKFSTFIVIKKLLSLKCLIVVLPEDHQNRCLSDITYSWVEVILRLGTALSFLYFEIAYIS
jgi:hypothetical protein